MPTGNTEFRFRAADLDFKSASYDWLLVAGARGMFKGVGTINGAGDDPVTALGGGSIRIHTGK